MIDRNTAPKISSPEALKIPSPTSVVLPNGCQIHRFELGYQPVVKLEWIFDEPTGLPYQPGVGYFTYKLLTEGTTSKTSKEIKDAFAYFGASIEAHHGTDKSSIVVYALSKFLPELLPLVYEILYAPSFPSEELESLKSNTAQHIKINLEKTAQLAQNAFREELYGKNHPYGHSLAVDEVRSVEREDIVHFYNQALAHVPFHLIVSGSISESEYKAILNTTLKLTTDGQPFTQKIHVSMVSPSRREVQKDKALQASIRVGAWIMDRKDPQYFTFLVLNKILGGYFGSRLMKNIREDKGYTYGISSVLVHHQYAQHMVIGTDVKNEFAQATLDEIQKEFEILRTTLVSQEELETVRQYMLGSFNSNSSTPFQISDRFKSVYFAGLGLDHYEEYIRHIKTVTSEEILHLAKDRLDIEKFFVVKSGDFSK